MCKQQELLKVKYVAIFQNLDVLHSLFMFSYETLTG